MGNEYVGISKKFDGWRDTHLKIKGDAVYSLQERFLQDWGFASKKKLAHEKKYYPKIKTEGNIGIQVVTSGPDSIDEHIKEGYIKLINMAKNNIYIQSPYFIPDESLFTALKLAALSGVDVRIMMPNKPDHYFVYWATLSYLGDLLQSGVKVYTYEKGFLHAKTIVVDDVVASVGSANFDIRSFKLSFEVNAVLYDENKVKELSDIFISDINNSEEITIEKYKDRSIIIKVKEGISRLLSPIL